MKFRFLLASITGGLAVIQCAGTLAAEESHSAALKVFLQGGPSASLGELVEENGGTVTHDLHIIDAVGAELTRDQLERVLESPLVARYFDDLSVSVEPVPPEKASVENCDVGGAVELDFTDDGISWVLHNKLPDPAVLERIEMTWPARLGSIERLALDGKMLLPSRYRQGGEGSIDLRIEDTENAPTPTLNGTGDLRLQFQARHGGGGISGVLQRDFSIKASFAGGCSTELIPGYADNHENFHYPEVAGAAALHRHGVTGKGVTVAVLDSGLWEHPALANDTSGRNRVIARYDAIANSTGEVVFDESGHGTHMTSVIAHSGPTTSGGEPTGSYKGISPDVNLVVVKAFNVEGQGDFLDIVRGIQWVVDHREAYAVRVLNLSFAARPRWHYWLDPINQAIMRAWAKGITVVAAAGNEGPDAMTIGSPGNLPYVITVGAVTDSWTPQDRDDDYIPDFSSRGPTPNAHIKPDLVAPGGHITGLTRPGSGLTLEHPEYLLRTGEFVMTGSSQASALVSGIVALLLQMEPELLPDDVKCKLITSAEPAINADGLLAYSPFQQGHGYVNASRAVTLGQRGCGNPELDIEADIVGSLHFRGPAIVEQDGTASLPGLEAMVSAVPSEKGMSSSRKWGVKAHIERSETPREKTAAPDDSPFDWQKLYQQEKSIIESLAGGNEGQ